MVRGRGDPLCGALEDRQVGRHLAAPGDQLDRGGAGADHADARVRQVQAVGPARGVEAGPRERVEPRDVRVVGVMEDPSGGDQEVGLVRFRRRKSAGASRAPSRRLPTSAPSGCGVVGGGVGEALEVGVDLRAVGVAMGPVRIGLEGVGVEVGRHVAGEPGVAVLAPGAATSSVFSKIVKSPIPASWSFTPASRPDMPAPITATRGARRDMEDSISKRAEAGRGAGPREAVQQDGQENQIPQDAGHHGQGGEPAEVDDGAEFGSRQHGERREQGDRRVEDGRATRSWVS